MGVSRRGMVRAALVAVMLSAAWLFFYGVQSLDNTTVPESSALPPVPSGATVVAQSASTYCGSDGCVRRRLVDVGDAGIAARLVDDLGLADERCRRDNWPDPRRTCVYAAVGEDGRMTQYAVLRW